MFFFHRFMQEEKWLVPHYYWLLVFQAAFDNDILYWLVYAMHFRCISSRGRSSSNTIQVMSHKFKSKLKLTWSSVGSSWNQLGCSFCFAHSLLLFFFHLCWLNRGFHSKYVYYKHFMHSCFGGFFSLLFFQFNLGAAKNFAILLHKDANDNIKGKKEQQQKKIKKNQMITKQKNCCSDIAS